MPISSTVHSELLHLADSEQVHGYPKTSQTVRRQSRFATFTEMGKRR